MQQPAFEAVEQTKQAAEAISWTIDAFYLIECEPFVGIAEPTPQAVLEAHRTNAARNRECAARVDGLIEFIKARQSLR